MSTDGHGPEQQALFEEFRKTGDRALRNQLVEANMGLASFFVRKYSRRGVAEDDLRQVAMLAILKAVERYDPDFGAAFSTFASRTIEGELRRYFRDRTWSVRPPRSIQELHLRIRSADEELAHTNGFPPSVAQIAEHLGVDLDDVLEAMDAGGAHQAASLDAPGPGDREDGSGWELPSEANFAGVENEMLTRQLLASLPPREQEILYLRFYENLSQSEIADRMGVSQSYLSRILRDCLTRLRATTRDSSG